MIVGRSLRIFEQKYHSISSAGGNLADSTHHQAKWKSMEESTFNYTSSSNHANIRPFTFLMSAQGTSGVDESGMGDADNCHQRDSVEEEEVAAI